MLTQERKYSYWMLAALAAAVIVVCILASGLGVRLALKVDPATALGG